jgi:DeoR family transcriptional regulator, glycerol-3-phosphate regulon repressor
MLNGYRHECILEKLAADKRIFVSNLASQFQVAEETIRRDLKELETRGLLRRVHGGAVIPRLDQEHPLAEREKVFPAEKERAAQVAASLLKDGMTIFIDTGSTPSAVARALPAALNLAIVTNSLDIAAHLSGQSNFRVTVAPGTLRMNDRALVGYETVKFAEKFYYDIAFMGIAACHADLGWMDYEEHEAVLRRALVKTARQSVFVTDVSKFGRAAHHRTLPLDAVPIVATNALPPETFMHRFQGLGVRVMHYVPLGSE